MYDELCMMSMTNMTNCHPEMFLGSHTKECTYRNNHNFRHDNCYCTCHPKNEKKKGNLKPELRKNMTNHTKND